MKQGLGSESRRVRRGMISRSTTFNDPWLAALQLALFDPAGRAGIDVPRFAVGRRDVTATGLERS